MTDRIPVPRTYADWAALIDRLKDKTGDEETLTAMKRGTIEWQTGVAERFISRLADAVTGRLNAAADKFAKEMAWAKGQERPIIQALAVLKKELRFLKDAVDLPAIASTQREQMIRIVKGHADKVQSSLESSAKTDRTGKLAFIVRNHKVNDF